MSIVLTLLLDTLFTQIPPMSPPSTSSPSSHPPCVLIPPRNKLFQTHPSRPIFKARRPRSLRTLRPSANEGYLMPYLAAYVVEEIVEDGQDPRGQVYGCEDELYQHSQLDVGDR